LIKRIGVDEKEAVKDLEEILLDDYVVLHRKVVAWIAEKAKLTEAKVEKILDNIKRKPEKFKTELEAILAKAKGNRV
jgi:UDP-N-acetylglucosamine:LPS N-acetylglucosamine transferase